MSRDHRIGAGLMRGGQGFHRGSTIVLSAAMVVIGLAILVRTLGAGGGPLAIGTVLGVLFVLAGAGRLYFTWRGIG